VIKLGIIGTSQGNGHPYSYSAIFNGYNKNEVKLVRKKTRNKAFFEKFFDFFN